MLQICRYILRHISINRFINFGSIASQSYNTMSIARENHTAGLIIIGDEILKAQVKDTNSQYICTVLYECGIKVKKISIISDDVNGIANEIRDFAEKYTYVITSGGIGPTHDDMTFEEVRERQLPAYVSHPQYDPSLNIDGLESNGRKLSLAKAFDDSLHYHPTLVDIVKKLLTVKDPETPAYKLAYIPKKATLKFGVNPNTGKPSNYPCINMKNVYVFPGSPIFLEPLFSSLYKELFKTNRRFVKEELYIDAKEDSYAAALTSVAAQFPRVTFGSYPVSDPSVRYKARVTIESDNEDETNEARDKFISLVPSNIFVNDEFSGTS